ncbi:MAG TPA: hypothetical protein VFQ54_09940, partial [Thermomicrobiales bacterium]|nr:hypothetical protein [Thermomicrobiales bacterium]
KLSLSRQVRRCEAEESLHEIEVHSRGSRRGRWERGSTARANWSLDCGPATRCARDPGLRSG